jgi:hypothetical protein
MNPTAAPIAPREETTAETPASALLPRGETERCGFQIGWDHARHGLVPSADLLVDSTQVGQGWLAGKAVFGRRCLPTTPALRWWLRLRTEAWLAGAPFDLTTVTPKWLVRIVASHCPVTRQPLGGAPGAGSAPVTVRLNAGAGYRAGNLVVLSERAATAIAGLDTRSALRHSTPASRTHGPSVDLGAGSTSPAQPLAPQQAARLAVLLGLRSALPFCDAARVPLHLLPPPMVDPVNPLQALQALLTRQFATPGWSLRLRGLADLLPADARGQRDAALRHDFNLFVGALAPRLLGAGTGSAGRVPDSALEDAWADERVQRRWQRFAAALGEARTTTFLDSAMPRAAVCAGGHAPRRSGQGAFSRPPAARPGTVRPPAARAPRASVHHPAAAT